MFYMLTRVALVSLGHVRSHRTFLFTEYVPKQLELGFCQYLTPIPSHSLSLVPSSSLLMADMRRPVGPRQKIP